MKKIPVALAFAVLSTSAFADLSMQVVKDYSRAADQSFWKNPKADEVPQGLISNVQISDPSSPYSSLFPKNFLQSNKFIVCYIDCKSPDQFKVAGNELRIDPKNKNFNSWDLLEQNNIYYWLSNYTSHLEKNFNFLPKWHLQVYSSHIVRDENNGSVMRNNAFYNPMNNTLSFLPATETNFLKDVMSKYLKTKKINRSGFDPSVVLHETSHFLFEHLFADPINSEVKGINEGFADYMANSMLGDPRVGLVMLQGAALRDSSKLTDSENKLRAYSPRMEEHDLGELVAAALWYSRNLAPDKLAFDAVVIENVKLLSQNIYATAHDFKDVMIERIRYDFPAPAAADAISKWREIFAGSSTKVFSQDFLKAPRNSKNFFGFKLRQIISKELAEQIGSNGDMKSNYTILDEQVVQPGETKEVGPKQFAVLVASENEEETITTPYWMVIDTQRNNIIGAYNSIDGSLVKEKSKSKELSGLAQDVMNANGQTKDFIQKLSLFTQMAQGKGELSSVYKVTGSSVKQVEVSMNGVKQPGHEYEMLISKKRLSLAGILTGVLSKVLGAGGLPDIKSITLITAPALEGVKLPLANGESVVGYRLLLKSGSGSEVILNKFGVQK